MLVEYRLNEFFFLFIAVLSLFMTIVDGTEPNYVNAQNTSNSNTTLIDINNSTSDEKRISKNSTEVGTEASSPSEDEYTGGIASLPGKCLGSALCLD